MAVDRLRNAKKEPLLDDRIPHPYREIFKQGIETNNLLQQIVALLQRPAPSVRIPGQYPPAQPRDYVDVVANGLALFGGLRLAQDLSIETVDLATARATPVEFAKLSGIALTIFRNTGSFDLYLNEKDVPHKLTIDALTYPSALNIDWLRIKTVWIVNTAQAGKTAVLIAWKPVAEPKAVAATPASLVITPADREAFRKLGDVNRDGVIDTVDLNLIKDAFGAEKGQAKYNSDYDLNGDGYIGTDDINTAAQHYGLTIEQWKARK